MIAALHGLAVTTLDPLDLPTEPSRAAVAIATTRGDVVILGSDLPLDLAMATARELTATAPEIDILLLAARSESNLVDAMDNGVRHVLSPDTDPETIRATVNRIGGQGALRRSRLGGSASADQMPPEGCVITTMAAKGGVGKTTIAVNLAVDLARSHPNDVVLVDFDLTSGDVDLLLGLEPATNLTAIACEGAVVDSAVVKLSLSTHSSGLLVLPAPDTLVGADSIDPGRAFDVLQVLKAAFSYVVVDTAPGAGAALAAAVEAADELLAIATPDAGGLRSLRRNLDGLDALGLDTARRHLVLNRAHHRSGLTTQTIETAVDMPIALSIPDSGEVPTAANQNVPLVLVNPKAEPARAIKALTARIAPSAATGPDRSRPSAVA